MRRFVETALKETPAIDGPKYTRYMNKISAGMEPIFNRTSTYHLLDDIADPGKSLTADCACNKAEGWHPEEHDKGAPVARLYKAKVYPQATQQAFKRNRARGPRINGQDQYMGFQNSGGFGRPSTSSSADFASGSSNQQSSSRFYRR